MNKKAMTSGFLVAIIITLVAFVLIAGTVSRFMSKADDKAAEQLCHDSLALRVRSAVNIAGQEIKYSPMFCKTIDKKITGTKEEVMKQIADKSARAWWMFGEGRYEEILKGGMKSVLPEFSSSNDCFLAYNIMIDESSGRLLRRVLGLKSLGPSYSDDKLLQIASELLPRKSSREFNLGLLDIAAEFCHSRMPDCRSCPLVSMCVFSASRV